MILTQKINKIPEFYTIFARKMPEFYTIIARKNIFPEFGGGARAPCPPSTPMPKKSAPSKTNSWLRFINKTKFLSDVDFLIHPCAI